MDIHPQHTNIAQGKGNDFIADVINCPDELEPVLAQIEHINDLGKSKWYEVVYYDVNWRSYSGSETFDDGEKVIKWKYCKALLITVTRSH